MSNWCDAVVELEQSYTFHWPPFLCILICFFLIVIASLYGRKIEGHCVLILSFWKNKCFSLLPFFYPHLSVFNDMSSNLWFVRYFYTSVSFLSIGASGGSFVVLKMVCFSSCFHCRSRPSNLLALIYIICHWKFLLPQWLETSWHPFFWNQA